MPMAAVLWIPAQGLPTALSKPIRRARVQTRRDTVFVCHYTWMLYENGVLKPLQPIDLAENEQVALTITPINRASGIYEPDLEYVENLRNSLKNAGPAPGLEEVRRRLS